MSFGGYKFVGYRVDNTQYSTSIERCLAIHAARIRAFLNASSLSGDPWFEDPDWLSGELSFNASTGVITSGVNNGLIHELIGEDTTVHGYSSYFKYSSGGVNGYYFIMTVDNYNVDYESSGANGISLNKYTMPMGYNYSYQYYGVAGCTASCFHCFSKDPFSHAPSGYEGKDYRYLNTNGQGSTKLKSIGFNYYNYIPTLSGNISSGFVNSSTNITLMGYAVKDKDIIVLCSCANSSNYSNPFNSDVNTHVSVMSLDGFSELYCKDDVYKFLQLEIKNGYYLYSSPVNDEISCNCFNGEWSTVLDVNGVQKGGNVLNDTNHTRYGSPILFCDLKTAYNPSGANYTPFSGLSIYCHWVSDVQCAKGCTNPELVSINTGTSSTSNPVFSSVIDGNNLFIGRFTSNFSYIANNSSGFSTDTTWYFDLYVGWDVSNPDIRTDTAWPEYNATIPV